MSNELIGEGEGGVFLWAGWPEREEIYVSFLFYVFVCGVGCVARIGV